MKKIAAIAIIVFVLAFSGSAYALALYDVHGTTGAEHYFRGTLGIEGIDNVYFDLVEGQTYNWFYDLEFSMWPFNDEDSIFLGTSSHSGTAEVTFLLDKEYPPGSNWFTLEGDNGAVLSHVYEGPEWVDPNFGIFRYTSLNQINGPSHSVPEPSSMLLFMSGLLGVAAFRKKFKIEG